MRTVLKKNINPIIILCAWIALMIILTPIFMFISNIGASGGEQKPLITLATMIAVACYGMTVLSILTALIFLNWFKKNRWFALIIALILIPIGFDLYSKASKYPFNSTESYSQVDGKEIRTKKEYYDDFTKLRSISFWINGRKDSVWKIFSADGRIMKQQTFHDDKLVGE